MPHDLKRYHGYDHLHLITCSCYRRLPKFALPQSRDCFLTILEQTRQRYDFVVLGYVVMPEHIHLLVGEPRVGDLSKVMQVLKQRSARALLARRPRADPRQLRLFRAAAERSPFWQVRFYDFNVWSARKINEKLRYIHRNPVKRGLVERPEDWAWSSCRAYRTAEMGVVTINADCGKSVHPTR